MAERRWDAEPIWGEARERARSDVKSAFAPRTRTCHACGRTSETSSRACPACGAPYVVMQPKLSPRAKRAIALAALALGVAGVVVWVLVSPSIDHTKRATAAREAAQHAAFVRSETRRLRADQRLHRGRAAAAITSRAALVGALDRAILADARARVRAGSLHGPILRAVCKPVTEGPLVPTARRGGYVCTAVTADIPKEGRGSTAVGGTLGYPFWAIVEYRRRTFAWCKVNPPPGEQAVQANAALVPPPAGCDLGI
jgi:hypothetical protein